MKNGYLRETANRFKKVFLEKTYIIKNISVSRKLQFNDEDKCQGERKKAETA